MNSQVRAATLADTSGCLELAAEVEDLFGPMPHFDKQVRNSIGRGVVLVVACETKVHGAALLSRDDQPHHINWLSVRSTSRRTGIASLLMEGILNRWPTDAIEVVTFGSDVAGGLPARRFYERHGFRSLGPAQPAEDGSPRDRFVRPAEFFMD
ncbi:GNAT family N-acetyltransferase [Arthrobacter sp. ISL-48]|uniref:GNAT family N-acetyltransferase n=1 Tax=Arthrobacter sp. ISL-48 TaxID=2819110 RepID=UPI001BE8B406|nr:GNAT family N-acetyltransferase [Arthrobacter sp. ISL-48]MBT2530758.1 GNAT family N-acetyltransferase [Arthrobacter sp. ISL-48]